MQVETLESRFRAGQEAAVREVHARYAGPVATVARSIVGSDPELVSEVVQQTFIKAWRAAATFDADRDMAPWLYSIARRSAIDVLRREKRGGPLIELTGDEPAPERNTFEQSWELWQVRQAIDDLPEPERDVVRMARLLGMGHAEIAERLNVPVGTVKSRTARAHKRLSSALRHLDDSDGGA